VPLACLLAAAVLGTAGLDALDRDVTLQDMERALAIARATDSERARFHAPYVKRIDTPFVESVEVISEFRRVVLTAEDRIRKGDRMFAYSTTQMQQAVAPWKARVSIVARMRFHPQNTYVGVPNVEIDLPLHERARIGVLKEPVLGLPGENERARLPVLGAVVEGVFDIAFVPEGTHEFVIRLDKKEVGRVTFDLAALE
jgi:hypothetical protein